MLTLFFSSSSRSRSRSVSPLADPQFITSFGVGSSDEEPAVMLGPALPPHLMPQADFKPSPLNYDSNGRRHSRSVAKLRQCLLIFSCDCVF